MFSIGTILLPTDFSAASLAAAYDAGAIARRFHSKIIVLHAIEPVTVAFGYPTFTNAEYMEDIRAAERCGAQKQIESFAGLALHDCEVVRSLVDGDAAGAIIDCAESEDVQLIMMPTRGCGVFRQFILGSVTAKVLHDVRRPVWTGVHVEQMAAVAHPAATTVLCAVDADSDYTGACRWAGKCASEFGARLVLIHAIPYLGYNLEFDRLNTEFADYLRKHAKERLALLASECGIRSYEAEIGDGNVVDVVGMAALNHHADLLVIGRQPKPGFAGRLRTHSYALIHESPCPVVSV